MTVYRRASSGITFSQVSELSPMPWISNTGGPLPTMRKARQ